MTNDERNAMTNDERNAVAEEVMVEVIEKLVTEYGTEEAGRILRRVMREARGALHAWDDITEMLD